ncbi:MAG: hypothetical protein ACI4BD_05965 [Paludibacteraceae bacterium]
MDYQLFKNGNARFPVSTDTLQFIQEQIQLIAKMAYIIGGSKDEYAVIKQPSSPSAMDGLCIFNGELLPLMGNSREDGIEIIETKEDITANGITFTGARTRRYANYTSGGNEYSDTFGFLTLHDQLLKYTALEALHKQDKKALEQLISDEAATRAQHDLPKGSIIDWYGTCNCASIPYGYVPCGRFFTGSSSDILKREDEIAEWRARYSSITIKNGNTSDGINFSILITQCNGQTVPDLTDRFIVQAGNTYDLASKGGLSTVSLQPQHLPSHKHFIGNISDITSDKIANSGADEKEYILKGDPKSKYTGSGVYNDAGELKTSAGNNGTSHENRPPYYALYKLIKVI